LGFDLARRAIQSSRSAVALTIRKALSDPGSETLVTWAIDGAAGVLALCAVHRLTLTETLYPAHHAVANGAVVVAIVTARRRRACQQGRSPSVTAAG